jgi:hypothetical protein
MKNILIVLSFIFLSFGCLSQDKHVIDVINTDVIITKIGVSRDQTDIEAVAIYKGKKIKVYQIGFDGYNREYNVAIGFVIKREVTIIKEVKNNESIIFGRTTYKDFLAPGG